MQIEVRLMFVYFEQMPRFVSEFGFPATDVEALRQLESATFIPHVDFAELELSLHVLSSEAAVAEGYDWHRPELAERVQHIALFSGNVDFDQVALSDSLAAQGIVKSADEFNELKASIIVSSCLRKFAGDFVLAAEVASPGAMHPTQVQCHINGHQRWQQPIRPSLLTEARAEFSKAAWPPLSDLALTETLAWLRSVPGFDEGVPSGSLGRAIAALSHVVGYESESSGAALMWGMVGLESLYTSGREGLSEQLREKVAVLLGSPDEDKKRFSGLYSFRSRFVHGGLDTPLAYTPYDAVDAFRKLEGDMFRAELTAVALLTSTLQAMAAQGRTELDFRWVLESLPAPPNKGIERTASALD